MSVHQTDTSLKQGMGFDHVPHIAHLRDFDHREQIKRSNRFLPVWQVAKNELGNHKRMHGNRVSLKLLGECGVSFTKVIDPYRCIGKNHSAFALLRGM
jgi:hypothetical protein